MFEVPLLPGVEPKPLKAQSTGSFTKHCPVELLALTEILTNVFKSSPNTVIETGVLGIKK